MARNRATAKAGNHCIHGGARAAERGFHFHAENTAAARGHRAVDHDHAGRAFQRFSHRVIRERTEALQADNTHVEAFIPELIHGILDRADAGTHADHADIRVFGTVRGEETAGAAAENLCKLFLHAGQDFKRRIETVLRKVTDFGKRFRSHHGADRHRILRIEHLTRLIGREELIHLLLGRNIHAFERVRQNETVHADHHGERQLFGDTESLNMEIDRFLIIFSKQLQPAAVALGERVRLIVPDVDRGADRAVRDRHHDRKTETRGVINCLSHEEQALGSRRCIGAGTGGACADRDAHRAEFTLHIEVLAVLNLSRAHQAAERLNDMGLGGNRISADDIGAAQGHSLRDALRTFQLLQHYSSPPFLIKSQAPRATSAFA